MKIFNGYDKKKTEKSVSKHGVDSSKLCQTDVGFPFIKGWQWSQSFPGYNHNNHNLF